MEMRNLTRSLALPIALFTLVLSLATDAGAATRIVFATQGRLEAVSPHGGSPHLLRRIPGGTVDIAASANGRRFALIVNRRLPVGQHGSLRTLYLLRLGHGLRKIKRLRTDGPLEIAMSPRGDEVAFDKGAELWTVDVDGSHERQVTKGAGVAFSPAYMPDGNGLVFARSATGTPEILKARFGGGESAVGFGEGRMPSVAPDGRIVYFASVQGPGAERIVVMNADGSGRHTIDRAFEPIFDVKPTFSPSGRSVAFLRLNEHNGRSETYRYSIHTVTASGRHHARVLGGLRAGPGRRGPLGPLWVPAA